MVLLLKSVFFYNRFRISNQSLARKFLRFSSAFSLSLFLVLSGCNGNSSKKAAPQNPRDEKSDNQPSIFGKPLIFGTGSSSASDNKNVDYVNNALTKKEEAPSTKIIPGIGYAGTILWRASLETISFLPLASADANSGIIITDWYSTPDYPNDRFKINLYIKSLQLRADAIKISVFKQSRDNKNAGWNDIAPDSRTASDMENAILVRARQLQLETLAPK